MGAGLAGVQKNKVEATLEHARILNDLDKTIVRALLELAKHYPSGWIPLCPMNLAYIVEKTGQLHGMHDSCATEWVEDRINHFALIEFLEMRAVYSNHEHVGDEISFPIPRTDIDDADQKFLQSCGVRL